MLRAQQQPLLTVEFCEHRSSRRRPIPQCGQRCYIGIAAQPNVPHWPTSIARIASRKDVVIRRYDIGKLSGIASSSFYLGFAPVECTRLMIWHGQMLPTIQLKISGLRHPLATSRPRCSNNQLRTRNKIDAFPSPLLSQPLLSLEELSATTTQNLRLRCGPRQSNIDSTK
jgi:hypothetical protein